MMNQELYEKLEKELMYHGIHEDVEDVLLGLAEAISDKEIMDRDVIYKETFGKTIIEAQGICTEEDGECSVKLKTVKIGKKEFDIDDYFL